MQLLTASARREYTVSRSVTKMRDLMSSPFDYPAPAPFDSSSQSPFEVPQEATPFVQPPSSRGPVVLLVLQLLLPIRESKSEKRKAHFDQF
jgi:hypothetical protein